MATDLTQVQKKLWDAAAELRANSGLQAAEYSGPVLGLICLRFAEERFAAAQAELGTGSACNPVGPDDFKARGFLYLPDEARYDHLLSQPESADLGRVLNNAMSAIEDHNPDLKGVLSKVYGTLPNNVLLELLRTLNSLADDIEGDGFGLVYEYFLGQFAMAEGQGGGEFFTPSSIVKLIVEVIEPFHGKIYDPACGSGGMFVQSADLVARHNRNPGSELSIYGQEASRRTVPLAKMNLAVHGLGGDILEGNTYYEDRHDSVGKFDFVMANPPFNVNKVDKAKLEDDPRFRLGLPNTDNANYLWIQSFRAALDAALAEAEDYLATNDIELADLEAATGFEFVNLLDSTVEGLLIDEATRKGWVQLSNRVRTAYKSLMPDPAAIGATKRVSIIRNVANKIASLGEQPDITDVMDGVSELLDRSVGTREYIIRAAGEEQALLDLNQIDWEQLAITFAANKRTAPKAVERELEKQIDDAVRKNPTVIHLAERLRQLIADYNAGTLNAEEYLRGPAQLHGSLDEHQCRVVEEELTEAELAIFDLLTKPAPELTDGELRKVRAAAQRLLVHIEETLVLDWKKKEESKAALRVAIRRVLDDELPEATGERSSTRSARRSTNTSTPALATTVRASTTVQSQLRRRQSGPCQRPRRTSPTQTSTRLTPNGLPG